MGIPSWIPSSYGNQELYKWKSPVFSGRTILILSNAVSIFPDFFQKRFIFNNPSSTLNETWYVPINYATARNLNFDDTKATNWIPTDSDLVLNLNLNANDFLIVNKQFAGYYRTNYDEDNWNLIADYLDTDNFEKIPPLTRATLLNDAFILARGQRVRYGIALNLAKYLHRETDYIPLKSLFNELGNFNQMFRGLDNYNLLEVLLPELHYSLHNTFPFRQDLQKAWKQPLLFLVLKKTKPIQKMKNMSTSLTEFK